MGAVNKRGTAMAEAALVFPMVILAVVTVLYIFIFLYMAAAGQAHLHMALRAEEGRASETVSVMGHGAEYRPEDKFGKAAFGKKLLIYEEKRAGTDRICGEWSIPRPGRGLLAGSGTKIQEAHVYAIDEVFYIRTADLLGLEKGGAESE